eukprot:scaffold1012_cov418-Prasinococcus_capsulatus_cf.AAC.2
MAGRSRLASAVCAWEEPLHAGPHCPPGLHPRRTLRPQLGLSTVRQEGVSRSCPLAGKIVSGDDACRAQLGKAVNAN